jgi:hypothetical protein
VSHWLVIGCANSVAVPNNHMYYWRRLSQCVCVKFKSQQTLPQVTLAFIFFGKHESDCGSDSHISTRVVKDWISAAENVGFLSEAVSQQTAREKRVSKRDILFVFNIGVSQLAALFL